MLDSLKSPGGKRWPRGQKFVMSPAGSVAEAAYREAIQGSRGQGRAALEAAQRAWATPLGIDVPDALVLGELRGGRKSIAEVGRALEDCGMTVSDVKASMDRLTAAGLVEPVVAAAAA